MKKIAKNATIGAKTKDFMLSGFKNIYFQRKNY